MTDTPLACRGAGLAPPDVAEQFCPDKKRGRPPPLSAAQIVRADAVIVALARLWPRCFHLYERRRRPLAIGIDRTLIERMAPAIKAGRISEADIRSALQWYTLADGYLENCAITGNPRISLDGRPSGAVTQQQACHARESIRRRRKRKKARSRTNYDPDDALR